MLFYSALLQKGKQGCSWKHFIRQGSAFLIQRKKKKLQLSHNVVRQTDVNSNFLAFPSTTSCG